MKVTMDSTNKNLSNHKKLLIKKLSNTKNYKDTLNLLHKE
jgi:hypothetical protein